MAVLAFASFNGVPGTDLVDYTPDTGGQFIEHPHESAGQAVISNEGRARGNLAAASTVVLAAPMPVADYRVRGVMHVKSLLGACAVVARNALDARTGVLVGYQASISSWIIAEMVTGAITQIQTVPQALSVGNDYEIELDVHGNTLDAYV